MGGQSARDMREMLGQEQLLDWHLSHNHYPPLPKSMQKVAAEAIKHADNDEWDVKLEMPKEILFRGRTTITVAEAIESMHLDDFLGGTDELTTAEAGDEPNGDS